MAQTVGGADPNVITLAGTQLTFTDWAMPEHVSFGGPYQHTVHFQPGGARQIDMLGNNPKPFRFSGIFIGAQAEQNFQYFEQLKVAGNPTTLQFGVVKAQQVVITDLTWEYFYNSRIEYMVECTPVLDGDNAGPAAAAAPNLAGAAGIGGGP